MASQIVGTPQTMRKVNQDRIEETIRMKGPLSRPDIARETGLSLVTVNRSVEALLSEDKIKKAGLEDSNNSGRRPMLFQINDKLYNYLFAYICKMISLSGSTLTAALSTSSLTALNRSSKNTRKRLTGASSSGCPASSTKALSNRSHLCPS